MEILKEIIETIIGWILLISLVYYIYIKYKKRKQNKIQQLQNYYNNINKEIGKNNLNKHYELNTNIFTDTERFFYKVLKEITKKFELDILTKVRLADIIHTYDNNYKYFNKIKAKHIDFVLIDKNGNIKLLIELDDNSHLNPQRQKRDIFLNNIFKDTDITLLRVPAKYIYNEIELENKIKESL